MGLVKKILGWAVALVVGVLVLQLVASESGEVVTLRTFGPDGAAETRLWVAEDRGAAWLRAGHPGSSWYQRILANPDIEVERGGELSEYKAFPVEGGPARDRINDRMREKYGWADQVIDMMFGRTDAVPIRLDPRGTPNVPRLPGES